MVILAPPIRFHIDDILEYPSNIVLKQDLILSYFLPHQILHPFPDSLLVNLNAHIVNLFLMRF